MKRMVKKEVIISFIIGVMLASSIAVYATINANEIDYKNGKKVSQALDELYNNIKETSDTEKSINANGKQTLDKYYKNLNVNVPNGNFDLDNDNVITEQSNIIDNTVSKNYTATKDEIVVICLSETGYNGYSNNIETTGTILYDTNNLNKSAYAVEVRAYWYINIRTITIKLEKDDTITISSYGKGYGSGQYSITHIL